jgi:major membrane immunogen (membrane-anchored lipoprotein)
MRITSAFRRTFIVLFTFATLLLTNCGNSDKGTYPGKLGIQHAPKLSREERKVEADFAKYLEDNTDEAVARYKKQYGNLINTDNARELSEVYAPHGMGAQDDLAREARMKWSAATQEPSRALAKEMYRRSLGKGHLVVFSAGGAGSGKSTTIGLYEMKGAEVVYDTTLSDLTGSMERIQQALDAGSEVQIIYVYRDPVDAFVNGVLPRAEENGRTVGLNEFINTHLGARESLLQISQKYGKEKKVKITVVNNSLGKGEAAIADLELVEKAVKYDRDDLMKKLLRALDEAYEKGRISEHAYRAMQDNSN